MQLRPLLLVFARLLENIRYLYQDPGQSQKQDQLSLLGHPSLEVLVIYKKRLEELFHGLPKILQRKMLQKMLIGKEKVLDYHHLIESLGRQWLEFKKIVFHLFLLMAKSGFLLFPLQRNGC